MSDSKNPIATDRFAENQGVYAIGEVVQHYADAGKLKTAEEAILRRLRGRIQDACLLDIGVGGGRTTSHLLAISADYTGVDYAPEMVAACRAKYPGVNFQEADPEVQKDKAWILFLPDAGYRLCHFVHSSTPH